MEKGNKREKRKNPNRKRKIKGGKEKNPNRKGK